MEVAEEIYNEFINSGYVPHDVISNIAEKIIGGIELSLREQDILNTNTSLINTVIDVYHVSRSD